MAGQVRRVAVVGGGVSGLATARHLVAPAGEPAGDAGTSFEVTVLEAAAALGGKIAGAEVGGIAVDVGPDALMVRAPAAARTVTELGLDAELRPPSGGGAFLWSRGRLRPLPAGSMFGVPDRLWPLLRSGLLGPWGFVRAGADLVLPRRELGGDPTIEQVLRPRFGRQVFERLVEPMLGGVHAGRAGRLSARSAAGEVMALAQGRRSLYLALRERRRPAAPAAGARAAAPARPPLTSLTGGLTRLVDALAAVVAAAPRTRLVTGARVTAIVPWDGGYRLTGDGFEPLDVDDVVLAVPAWEAARLLRPLVPAAADALAAIPYAGVATVILAYPAAAIGRPLTGTGFLVPPAEGRLLVGCSWLTAKWPHLTAGAAGAPVLIRAMVGRDGDQAWSELDDDALVGAVREELREAMGVTGPPSDVRVRRMPLAMPQYTVGHADRLAAAEGALGALPGVHLTGAGYRGVGISGCLAQAQDAASAVRARAARAVTA